MIYESEVLEAQKKWGNAIIEIGKKKDDEDLASFTLAKIKELYNYENGTVLFKPTLASEKQFRLSIEGALSYFIGQNNKFSEDNGFAIKPWTAVRFENASIILDNGRAMAMGNYYFTETNGQVTKVEYTFAYKKDQNGDLRIDVHHSSLPFSP